ncbi:dihydropteroate synthase [Caldicellulosiruptor naganoensis]|uniref:Dihydropteroate synthase n=1 Tax=Caldicellulosiruptor naganoensis TaxID=29324 RepID=A0ABY7BHD1_9FIRM|nr:dihydropteroate synthase [Caldicellulosiruptor naganoensis]WAM31140.1 dihydropteroate synthase [Caldicellulosiruptor naganoensis]
MIIIGEKINSTVKNVADAIKEGNFEYIVELAKKQYLAGAHYIDVNAGAFVDEETEILKKMVESIQKEVSVPLSIDSPRPEVIGEVMKIYKGERAIFNSVIYEEEILSRALPIIKEYNMKVVALLMDDVGIPDEPEKRVEIAKRLVDRLTSNGILEEDIFLDPMLQPVSVDQRYVDVALETIKLIRKEFENVNIICGLSNVSFGLPKRRWLNRAFLPIAIYFGLNSCIADPLDDVLMKLIYAAEALSGQDEFCMEYITKAREGFLD